ncbi:MAG: hypothetical protein ACI8RD_008181 [Bacillariaceae sp.]|jgi:hypothetical protein
MVLFDIFPCRTSRISNGPSIIGLQHITMTIYFSSDMMKVLWNEGYLEPNYQKNF